MMGNAYRHLMRHESRDAQADVPAFSVTSRRVSLIIDLNGTIRVVRERTLVGSSARAVRTCSGNVFVDEPDYDDYAQTGAQLGI
jgi:hypothetical protein